jgi:hypothetical protein
VATHVESLVTSNDRFTSVGVSSKDESSRNALAARIARMLGRRRLVFLPCFPESALLGPAGLATAGKPMAR